MYAMNVGIFVATCISNNANSTKTDGGADFASTGNQIIIMVQLILRNVDFSL